MPEKKNTPSGKKPAAKAKAKAAAAPDPAPQGPQRLLRSRSERMLWGVAGGLAERIGVDPTYVRLGFAAATFFGGFGVLAYLILAVVVPMDDGTGNPESERRPPKWAIVALAIALLVILPGGFWGWGGGGHGWWFWGWFGPVWLTVLVVGGALAIRALRRGGRGPWSGSGSGSGSGSSARPAASATADTAVMDPGARRTAARRSADIGRVLLLIVAVAAGIAVAGVVAVVAMWVSATGHGAIIAGVVIALGIGIAAAAMLDNRAIAPWLLGAALLLAVPAGAVAAADVHFDSGIGEREHKPATVADIPADGYELGIGRLVVDLRDIDWQPGQTVDLKSELGIGQMVVSVPQDVCVDTDTDAKGGELYVRGAANDGVDVDNDESHSSTKAPRLDFEGDIQFGQLVVTDQDPDTLDDGGPGHHDDADDADEQNRQKEACAA